MFGSSCWHLLNAGHTGSIMGLCNCNCNCKCNGKCNVQCNCFAAAYQTYVICMHALAFCCHKAWKNHICMYMYLKNIKKISFKLASELTACLIKGGSVGKCWQLEYCRHQNGIAYRCQIEYVGCIYGAQKSKKSMVKRVFILL